MESTFFSAINTYRASRHEEDFVDRLNFRITSLIFLTATTLITYQSFFGRVLLCWTPVQFRGGWDEYTNDYCFVENTYFVPTSNRSLPSSNAQRDDAKLAYYQWIPFVLALQAMCFCIPHIFWRMVNWISGVQVRAVVTMAYQSVNAVTGIDEEKIKMLVNHLSSGLKMSREDHHSSTASTNPFGLFMRMLTVSAKCYISFCYFVMKGLFVVNIFIQLAVINLFLGVPGDSFTWGFSVLIDLFQGNYWHSTGVFPRSTMCDFEIRELGNVHRWSVQCVLPLNMFSEKIYLALWFWLIILLVTTIVNLIIWLFQILRPSARISYIDDMLATAQVVDSSFKPQHDANSANNKKQMFDDLGWDGVLILRIVHSNAGELACASMVKQLFKKYDDGSNGQSHIPELLMQATKTID